MIDVISSVDDGGSRGSRGITWLAECSIEGRTFIAQARSGAPNELARQLVEAGIPDQPMQTWDARTGMKQLYYRSFHDAAKWTYEESTKVPLHRVRWKAAPDFRAEAVGRDAENRGEEGAALGQPGSALQAHKTGDADG